MTKPDETLVKEIRSIKSGALTTGPGLWAGENKVWFVMVKDTKGRYAGNGNWGNGWGWALFEAKNRSVNASADHSNAGGGFHLRHPLAIRLRQNARECRVTGLSDATNHVAITE